MTQEANVQLASQWWPELTNLITHLGWRDHLHRFNIFYDGTILALPQPHKQLKFPWEKGEPMEGVQLSFAPSADGTPPPQPAEPYTLSLSNGSRIGDQGWLDHPAPVLWTRWQPSDGPLAGLTLRQLIFAHLSGGGEAQSGLERMFAWIRLEVADRDPSASAAEAGFLIKINAPHVRFDMIEADNFRVLRDASQYPKTLRSEQFCGSGGAGTVILENNDEVRLAILPGRARSVQFRPAADGQRDSYLHITFPAKAGWFVDLLLPMVPADRASLLEELGLGFHGALAQTNKFWKDRPSTAASIHTPEPLINAAVANSVRLARMLSVTVPSTRQRSLLSSSLVYAYLWLTPTSMTKHMLLDPLGWHEEVEKYLEMYRQEQGRITPPGPQFKPHPGYFGVPAALDSGYQWLTDHGSVLYTVARHALLTGNEKFIERWLDAILKGCDFIRDARRLPRESPAAAPVGVMPPASASDVLAPVQAFWSEGWCYKSLATSVRLLRLLNHSRAPELEQEARDYREAILRAFRAKAARQPRWTDRAGQQRVLVPMTLATDDSDGVGVGHPFYLDTGPIFGVYAGLLPADDQLMRDAVDFLREGSHMDEEDDAFGWKKKPRLIHEMSSAEPCYSWNVFHSHQLGDRPRYLECLYSLFAGALSRQTHVSCETRGGITENVFSNTLAIYLTRLAVVDDEVEPDALHLMRLVPLAWVSADDESRFENIPTEFGPMTLKWRLTDSGRTLQVTYEPRLRRPPKAVLLHIPPVPGLKKVIVNGREHAAGNLIKL